MVLVCGVSPVKLIEYQKVDLRGSLIKLPLLTKKQMSERKDIGSIVIKITPVGDDSVEIDMTVRNISDVKAMLALKSAASKAEKRVKERVEADDTDLCLCPDCVEARYFVKMVRKSEVGLRDN